VPVHLVPVPVDDLPLLVQGRTPRALRARTLDEALPPPFVADRSLTQLRGGKPAAWCAPFYMVRTADGAVVGSCGFKDVPRAGRIEIGYGVSPLARRQGAARAAVAALLRIAQASDEVAEVLAQVLPDNLASTRVVQGLGFLAHGRQLDHSGEMLVQWVYRCAA